MSTASIWGRRHHYLNLIACSSSPFAIQWVWPLPVFVGSILAPESPWWLCRRGRDSDARKALRKLTAQGSGVPFNVDAQVAMMEGKVAQLMGNTGPVRG
jgi:hypothetical protein